MKRHAFPKLGKWKDADARKAHSPQSAAPGAHSQMIQLQQTIGNQAVAQFMLSNMPFSSVMQRQEEPPNQTGMPDHLRSGIEDLSGMSMDDVNVHYNSSKPAQLNALAYAQGNDIHIGPGQEKHLPHEAWHVVQQRQGRVQPTMQTKDVAINDSPLLEKEADEMGAKAAQLKSSETTQSQVSEALPGRMADGEEHTETAQLQAQSTSGPVIQMVKRAELEEQARAAADSKAANISDAKSGHGRGAHGRDAGGKRALYSSEEAIARRRQEVWNLVYQQTLARLLKEHKKDLED